MSAAPKFTPGPWGAVSDEFGWCQRGIEYPDGDDRDHHLCVVQCGDPDELEANARLIATAPDLYAALARVTRQLRHEHPDDEAWIEAEAALARAEGKR